jgi:dihydroxyacid dehydratase/phosphogluconate dehydratase
MKMHSSKFKDPWISRAQPVTLISPLVEETLRVAGITANREHIIDRFMGGQPRIAIVHGGEDHPPHFGMKETARRIARHIWASEGLPFDVSQAVPCEELSRGTDGGNCALLSRNVCTTGLAGHMETHGYDAAVVIGVCDKMMAGDLRALVEVDLARQRRKARPVFATIIPSVIQREVFATDEELRRFESIESRLPSLERSELHELVRRPLKSGVYVALKTLLDRSVKLKHLHEDSRDELEKLLVRCAATPGGGCAASEASVVHRMMLAAFGLVPRHLEMLLKPPSDEQIAEAVKRLILAIQKRERRVSVAGLVRSNLTNAASVWSATGGHAAWLLHLAYLADAVGKKLSIVDITRRARTVPQILAIGETAGKSVYSMALETETGGNSGIDTIMRTLAEKRFIEDRTSTLDGSWTQRIMDARSANGNFLHSTMTPCSPSYCLRAIQGNLCSGGIARLGWRSNKGTGGSAGSGIEEYDGRIYLAVYYLGIRELQADLDVPDGVLERLKGKMTREALYDTLLLDRRGAAALGREDEIAQWSKARLWEAMCASGILRVIVVVAGAGPHAAGMPELHLEGGSSRLPGVSLVLLTDGRVSWEHDGLSIAHVVPEAFDGGALAGVRTGDWIFLDVGKGEIHVVEPSRGHSPYRALSAKELMSRPDRKRRLHELHKRRMELMPSLRALLDRVSSAESGVSPGSGI